MNHGKYFGFDIPRTFLNEIPDKITIYRTTTITCKRSFKLWYNMIWTSCSWRRLVYNIL